LRAAEQPGVSCAKFTVRGMVQGVCFRASTRDMAMRLGLSGYAQNLADGSVEVLACGDDTALHSLERWLAIGPPAARVTNVSRDAASVASPTGFRVL
jgi:acylphosphatase